VIRKAASGGGMDRDAVAAIVNEEVAKAAAAGLFEVTHTFQTPDGKVIGKLEGEAMHSAFDDVATEVAVDHPVLLKGPAGTGKSFLSKQVAKSLGLRFASMSLSGGTMEHHFLGSRLPDADGAFRHRSTQFLDAFENGGVMLLDEVDACDANVLLAINNGIANGVLPIPGRDDKPFAEKHKDFRLIAAANTYGTGPSAIYVGRNQLDGAFLDRFEKVEVDYCRKLEKSLVGDAIELAERWWAIRDKANAAKLRRIVSTRSLLRAVTHHKVMGYSVDKCVSKLTAGWTADELRTVEVA
jgi:MoxR-like ATPase